MLRVAVLVLQLGCLSGRVMAGWLNAWDVYEWVFYELIHPSTLWLLPCTLL